MAIALAGEPVWDGHYYDFGARRIASGFGYADEVMRDGHPVWHPWCHYPVGYSGFLAAFYMLFGTGHGVAHFANALVGALLAVVTYLLAREALSARRAMVAGGLVALHPGLVLYGALLMTEPLSALLVLGAFYVAIRVARGFGGRPGGRSPASRAAPSCWGSPRSSGRRRSCARRSSRSRFPARRSAPQLVTCGSSERSAWRWHAASPSCPCCRGRRATVA